MFVNRKAEIARLKNALKRETPQLIVVFGRRRCGKSTLLRKVLTHEDVFFTADLREQTLQRNALAKTIGQFINGFERAVYPDWESLLLTLNTALKKRICLCLDEFPYLVKNAPELPSVIQKLWDEKELDNLHLILCGSSQQLMQDISIESQSPLYGRCNEIIRVDPMGVKPMAQFLNLDPIEAIREFTIWGGVPRYWEVRQTTNSLKEAIIYHILDKHGILHEEPERLFSDELRTFVQAFSVLSLIAGGCHKLSEIAARLQKPSTHLSPVLNTLIRLKYIRREVPFGDSQKSGKKSLYKINDPFIDFYFRFLLPAKNQLENGLAEQVYHQLEEKFEIFVSQHWEHLCRNAIPKLKLKDGPFLPASRWWGGGLHKKNLEVDIIASSTDRKTLLIGEVKWSDEINLPKIEQHFERTIQNLPFIKDQKILCAVFLKKKPTENHREILFFDAHDIILASDR